MENETKSTGSALRFCDGHMHKLVDGIIYSLCEDGTYMPESFPEPGSCAIIDGVKHIAVDPYGDFRECTDEEWDEWFRTLPKTKPAYPGSLFEKMGGFSELQEDGTYMDRLPNEDELEPVYWPEFLGKYGEMRHKYLMRSLGDNLLCSDLFVSGNLGRHLEEVDNEANDMMDILVPQMKKARGVTEELKARDQMEWVGRMNNIIHCAEEIVKREILWPEEYLSDEDEDGYEDFDAKLQKIRDMHASGDKAEVAEV